MKISRRSLRLLQVPLAPFPPEVVLDAGFVCRLKRSVFSAHLPHHGDLGRLD